VWRLGACPHQQRSNARVHAWRSSCLGGCNAWGMHGIWRVPCVAAMHATVMCSVWLCLQGTAVQR